MKCIFFGTPAVAAKTLRFLLEAGVEVAAVVTQPDKPRGRSGKPAFSPVKEVVEQWAEPLPLYQPEKASDPEFIAEMAGYEADLFLVVAYGQIMRQALLDAPKRACVNVHFSLLPQYRGAAPVQRSIVEGKKETGVTIMHMVRKLDAGNIILKKKVPIPPEATHGEMEECLGDLGCESLMEALELFKKGEVAGEPQDPDQVTYAAKIDPVDCEMDWSLPAQQIHDLVRGVNPKPCAWTRLFVRGKEKRLKVQRTRVHGALSGQPGEVLQWDKKGIVVACGQGAVELLSIQMEGKKVVEGAAFARGMPQKELSFFSP